MELQKHIRRVLKEETYEMSPLERTVADFVNMLLAEYELPDAFYKVAVDIFDDGYGRHECKLTTLFKKPFKMGESDRLHLIMNKIKKEINGYFGNIFSYTNTGTSTVQVYDEYKDSRDKRKSKKLNESEENKKEKKFNRLIQNVEDYLNSNEYPSVKRFTVYYEDTHDDVIVNIFFDAEEAVKLGVFIQKVRKQVMSDLEIFPLDFKYYTHFDKRQLTESENKKKSLLKNIRDVGLYDFIRMAGIELMDLQTQVGQIPREMLEQFIKDYISNEGKQYTSAKPDEKIVSIDVRVGGNAIIDFMYYDGKLLSFEVTEYAKGFSKDETDQYIEGAKNYGYDTIFNIANKISRKIN